MILHANAKLGLAGRRELVAAVEARASLRCAAAAFGVSPATAHRWWHRWLDGVGLCDRSSRPLRQPRHLSLAEEQRIVRARRRTNLGPGRLAGILDRARSTIWKVLHRHGLSRRAAAYILNLWQACTRAARQGSAGQSPSVSAVSSAARPRGGDATGWRAYVTVEDEVVMFCSACATREFGSS